MLDLGAGDLNDAMRYANDWPTEMQTAVNRATDQQRIDVGVGMGR